MTTTFKVIENLEKTKYKPDGQAFDEAMKYLGYHLRDSKESYEERVEVLRGTRERRTPFEAWDGPTSHVVWGSKYNGLWQAVHTAYNHHMPLGLSPDHVWLSIATVFSEFVAEDPEGLRKRFVNFEGKKYLEIQRDGFVKGSPDNDWPGAFAEWSEQIKKNTVSKVYELVTCNFSTTGPIEKAASEITLMSAMKHYFDYGMRTMCGIPEITLYGTPDDWVGILTKVKTLTEFEGLREWAGNLLPVIAQFVAASLGKPDIDWWKSFYQFMGGSGRDDITGHFAKFFRTTRVMGKNRGHFSSAPVPEDWPVIDANDLPMLVSQVPFVWHYYTTDYDMQLMAGIPFATIKDGVVMPAAVWAVGEAR